MARILFVVGDERLRDQLAEALIAAGHTVDRALSTKQAVALIGRDYDPYDAIVTSFYGKVIVDRALISAIDRPASGKQPTVVVVVENGSLANRNARMGAWAYEGARIIGAPIDDASFVRIIHAALALDDED